MTWGKEVKLAVAVCSVLVLGVICALGYVGWRVATWGSIPAQESIFAEIYADTAKNYERGSSIGRVQAVGRVDRANIDGDPGPLYYFNKNSDGLDDIDYIAMRFFFNSEKFVILYYINNLPHGLSLEENVMFDPKSHELHKNIRVKGADGKYLEGRAAIAQALADAGITKADVEGYYRAVVEDYILADWVEVFDSDFSPSSYGDVRVVDEWDIYF